MRWGKLLLIIIGAVGITAFSIDASDTLRGESSTMLAQLVGTKAKLCPDGMESIDSIPSLSCADAYEASPSPECPHQTPESGIDTERDIQEQRCHADSKANVEPWRFITRDQAMQMCARAGKRLPTNAEWYALALGAPTGSGTCNVQSTEVARGGTFAECVSPYHVYDLVGNVWEWVKDDVQDGSYQGVSLPGSGYVAQVNTEGVATEVKDTPQSLFGDDYFWSTTQGTVGIIRGGYYGSGNDGGLYAVHADALSTSATAGIGFRCVK